jgi:hypothetical protein
MIVRKKIEAGSTAVLRAALRAIPEAHSLHIRDEWNGLNPTAPWLTSYALERTDDGDFIGMASFEVRGSATVARAVRVPGVTAQPILEQLAAVRPVVSEYVPHFTHTDDYPALEIHLETAMGGVLFFSTSQGRYHTPWAIAHGGTTFVVTSAQPGKALERLQPFLHRETLTQLTDSLDCESDDPPR